MSTTNYDENGIRRLWEDDVTRVTRTYDANGVETSVVAYTAEQNARADATAASESASAELDALKEKMKAIVTDMQAEKARVQPVIDLQNNATITASNVKDVAKAAKRIADGVNDLARLVMALNYIN